MSGYFKTSLTGYSCNMDILWWRHTNCDPGKWRVSVGGDLRMIGNSFNAVVDDFGNLVRVP
jgi:hypothetical protein